jgi:predicted DNA-binding transcriptional regulator YafY
MPAKYERGEKFTHVIQVYERLCQTETGLTTVQLAEELEVTQRSVQRYLATLRDSVGLDIEEEDGRYRMGRGSLLPPMQLDRYQAMALLVALRLLHQMTPEHSPAVVGALAELARALHNPLLTRYVAATIEAAEVRAPNPQRRQIERVVIDGLVQGRVVEITYTDAKGQESKRAIRPYFLEPRPEGRAVYVFAFDESSREVRPFRLDRIATARLLPSGFQVPEDFDIDALVSGSWGIWQGPGRDEVVLRFLPEAARRVRETVWHPSAQLTDLDGGGIEMRLVVASEMEMRPWVLGWGANVEVLAPASLREHVGESMRQGAEMYGGDR